MKLFQNLLCAILTCTLVKVLLQSMIATYIQTMRINMVLLYIVRYVSALLIRLTMSFLPVDDIVNSSFFYEILIP